MSNSLAITAVTAALRSRLSAVTAALPGETTSELSDTLVTTLPPDKAGLAEDHSQVNLFLYQVQPSAPGRNLDGRGLAGRKPALALDLFYLVTFYGRNHGELLSQRLLGRVMSLLHSNPTLDAQEIEEAMRGTVSDLHQSGDRIRIVPHSMSSEEMVRLWGTFQVKYRLSVVYRVGIVLLDHEHPAAELAAPSQVKLSVGTIAGDDAQ